MEVEDPSAQKPKDKAKEKIGQVFYINYINYFGMKGGF